MSLEIHKIGVPVIGEPILTIEIQKEFDLALSRLRAENPLARINHLGNGRYKLDLPKITATGADVETIFNIPYMHAMERMETKHVDSALADSSNSYDYSVSHRHHPGLWILILAITGSTASDIIDEYQGYVFEKGEFKLTTNTTATELLYISAYIKITGV